NTIGKDVFKYTIKDADGDQAVAKLTIDADCPPPDDRPDIEGDIKPVNETGLRNGGTLNVSGTLVHDYGDDGAGNITPTGVFTAHTTAGGPAQTLRSNGDIITVTKTADGYVGTAAGRTIFTLKVNPQNGSYTYTQHDGIDHPIKDKVGTNDVVWLKFGVQ